MPDSAIASNKIAAYRAAHYRAGAGPDGFILRVDERSEPLARLYQATGRSCAAFITACNPMGREQGHAANLEAHQRLLDAVRILTPHVTEGAGIDPRGAWMEEKSLLALGIDQGTACRLGRAFRQDAVLWMGPDAIPRLQLLR